MYKNNKEIANAINHTLASMRVKQFKTELQRELQDM